jgi:MFS family permease
MYFHHAYLRNKFIKTTTIGVLYLFGAYLYSSFFTPYLQSIGWSSQHIGFFFSLFALFGIAFAPIIGALSDSIGRFRFIMLGIIIEAVGLIGYIAFENPFVLFGLRLLSSFSFTAVTVSTLARVEDTVDDEKQRSTISGLYSSIQAIAVLLAPIAGGLIADYFGYVWNFTASFVIMLCLLSGVFVYDKFSYKDNHPHRKKQKFLLRNINPIKAVENFWKIKELRPMAVLGFAANFAAPLRILIIPLLVVDTFGLTNTHLSALLFIIGLTHILQFLFGRLSDKVGSWKLIIIGNILLFALILLFFFIESYAFLFVVVTLFSLAASMWTVSAWSYMSEIGERMKIEGQVVGGYMAIAHKSHAISFVIVGSLMAISPNVVYALFASLILVAVAYAAPRLYLQNKEKQALKE